MERKRLVCVGTNWWSSEQGEFSGKRSRSLSRSAGRGGGAHQSLSIDADRSVTQAETGSWEVSVPASCSKQSARSETRFSGLSCEAQCLRLETEEWAT